MITLKKPGRRIPRGICIIEGCNNSRHSKGLCSKHYMATRKEAVKDQCSVEGCLNKTYSKGLCTKHYQRDLKYGSPLLLRKTEKTISDRPRAVEDPPFTEETG